MLVMSVSEWRGLKLIAGLWIAYFGMAAVMAQIETWYFAPALGIARGLAFSILLRDLILTAVFIPLAVLIMGKISGTSNRQPNTRLIMPLSQWAWKLPVIAVAYLILYFSFGQFVAWQNPAVREMYGGGTNLEVFAYARLIPFQIFRSMLWVLFTLPAIRFMQTRPWIGAILLGLLLALPMNIAHAIPNPIMPDPSVRLSHFIETATSNFLFGLLIYWLLHRMHTSLGDLFGGKPEMTGRMTARPAGD
jgi:hypothetical protein